MTAPKYVQDILERSEFNIDLKPKSIGYSILIYKRSDYETATSLAKEVERLRRWVERQMPKEEEGGVPTMTVDYLPGRTHHSSQYAKVTIYDPVMQRIEHLIKK